MEMLEVSALSTMALLVVVALCVSLSRCPECGSAATRAVGQMDPRVRICRTCFSLYKIGPR
jgi:hypothetical protein